MISNKQKNVFGKSRITFIFLLFTFILTVSCCGKKVLSDETKIETKIEYVDSIITIHDTTIIVQTVNILDTLYMETDKGTFEVYLDFETKEIVGTIKAKPFEITVSIPEKTIVETRVQTYEVKDSKRNRLKNYMIGFIVGFVACTIMSIFIILKYKK
jgi:hypothetical protein